MRSICLVLLAMVVTIESQADFPNLPEPARKAIKKNFMVVRKGFHDVLTSAGTTQHQLRAATKQQKVQKAIDQSVDFPCDVTLGKSPKVPTSVHKVRPGDIALVGALGDSLTASFGATATNILEVFRESRGFASLIGGQGTWREFLTMPNILKMYNPDLFGYSLGDSLSFEWKSQFNVAEGGAMTHDMPFMAKELISRISNDSRVDMKNHWKLISILIGGNDYCLDMCYYDENKYLKRRRQLLIETLDLLRDNLPRTLVNLVISPNAGQLLNWDVPLFCWFTHRMECPCVMGSKFAYKRKYYFQKIIEAQLMEFEIADMERYERDDFAVVAQPFLFNYTVPKTPDGKSDLSFFSADCFHLSQKGSARGGNAIWNNMLEPVGSKSTYWLPAYEEIKCVTAEHPYIFTKKNSQKKT